MAKNLIIVKINNPKDAISQRINRNLNPSGNSLKSKSGLKIAKPKVPTNAVIKFTKKTNDRMSMEKNFCKLPISEKSSSLNKPLGLDKPLNINGYACL